MRGITAIRAKRGECDNRPPASELWRGFAEFVCASGEGENELLTG